jgi:CheY-like chemotaxis protein
MVLGIVRRHGGDITVTSAPRQGTTVTLRFPAALGTVPAAVTAASPPAALPRPLCILVIDDVLALAQALAEILRAFGHEAEAVGSGQEGLARLAARRFDLLFTDLGMPEMSGWEVARAAKARWPTLPVVLVTGWGDTLETEALDGTGVDLILAKPYRREQLEATIAEAWALGQTK